jgi:hypothetical protein
MSEAGAGSDVTLLVTAAAMTLRRRSSAAAARRLKAPPWAARGAEKARPAPHMGGGAAGQAAAKLRRWG